MKTYAVFYTVRDALSVNKVTCFQKGEAWNWTVEEAAKAHGCDPSAVHVEVIIEVV